MQSHSKHKLPAMNPIHPIRKQRGINLIEIMVAMVIGLFLVAGATTLYVRSKQTADQDDSMARLQETARYALSVIETDVRMVNYWGLAKDGNNCTNCNYVSAYNPNKCDGGYCAADKAISSAATGYCGPQYVTDLPHYIQGTNNQFDSTLPCPADQSTISLSSDSLTVRRTSTQTAAASTTTPQVCSTRNSGLLVVNGDTCTQGELHNLLMNLYYVSTQSDGDTTIPSLRRVRLVDGPDTTTEEIVSGIEDMQVEFIWDSNSDAGVRAQPSRNVNPDDTLLNDATSGLPTGRIIGVRVWLLVRSDTTDPTYTDTRTYTYADRTGAATNNLNSAAARGKQYAPADKFHRLLVSKTIFIRNVTGT
jgi:type IV pilus assembly protein PilW